MPDLNDRYLNLALINIGEAITEISNVRQQGKPPGDDYKPACLALERACFSLAGLNYSSITQPEKKSEEVTSSSVPVVVEPVNDGVRVGDPADPADPAADNKQRWRWWGWGQRAIDRVS